MNPQRYFIPLAALLLVVTGLLIQLRTTLAMERENEQWQQRLLAVRPPAPHGLPQSPEGPIQWRNVLKHPRALNYLRERIQRMTKEEMIAALEEIAAIEDLSRDTRSTLESMFQQPLCDLDPEMGLNWFIRGFQRDRRDVGGWQAKVFYQWAQRDPTAAIAWYERQLADGKFEPLALDGRSGPRDCFEGALAGVLMATDPVAAAKRMAALSMGDRVDALWVCSSMAVNEATDLAFANLVRSQVSGRNGINLLTYQAKRAVTKDSLASAAAYLDRIHATPAERTACVEVAAKEFVSRRTWERKPAAEDFALIREWLATQAPEIADRTIGSALAESAASFPGGQGPQNLSFQEAAALALQERETSGNDEVLAVFLCGNAALHNKPASRDLAARIADPERRQKILDLLK